LPTRAAADHLVDLRAGRDVLVGVLAWLYIPRWRAVRRTQIASAVRRAGGWRCSSQASCCWSRRCCRRSTGFADQVFAMHMTQHVLLLDLVPICFMLSLTRILLRPRPSECRALEQGAGRLAHPAFAVGLYITLMWVLAPSGAV